jgi:hypothetical protein
MSQMGAVSQARQVAYNIVAVKTGQPKSPSGANEQHRCHRQARSLKRPTLFSVRTTIHIPRNARAASAAARFMTSGEKR